MIHGTGWPTHQRRLQHRERGQLDFAELPRRKIGAAAVQKKATSSPRCNRGTRPGSPRGAERFATGTQYGVFAEMTDAAQIEGDGERPATGMSAWEFPFQSLPHADEHGDPSIAEDRTVSGQAVLERGEQRFVDGESRSLAGFDPRAIGLGFGL
jgi:hypothetical protein